MRLPFVLFVSVFQIIFQCRPGRRLPAPGDGNAGTAGHPELSRRQLGHCRQIHHIGAVELDEPLIGQQGLGHLPEGHPDGEGGHIFAAGEVEMHHMVGTLEVLDICEGQGPQARCRSHRDDRAVLRLGPAEP